METGQWAWPSPRFKIEDAGNSLRIIIPSARPWLRVILLGIETIVIVALWFFAFSIKYPVCGLFLVGWFTIIGVVPICRAWLWLISGKEIIEVNSQSISARFQMWGYDRSRGGYLATHIEGLRVLPPNRDPLLYSWQPMLSAFPVEKIEGPVAFNFGAIIVRWGSEVGEAEAKQIVAAIQLRFPQYRN